MPSTLCPRPGEHCEDHSTDGEGSAGWSVVLSAHQEQQAQMATKLCGSHSVVVCTKGRVCVGPTDTGVLLCAVISRTVAGHLRRMGAMAATHGGEVGEAAA